MGRLRFLRRLLRKAHRPHVTITQLSTDILALITNHLSLHDQFLLSHTCRAFRRVASRDWDVEMSRLSSDDALRFWEGLAYASPNHWACPKCRKLHRINTSDVPAVSKLARERLVPCKVRLFRNTFEEAYCIQYYHIQLALKLSRLGNANENYLAALMRAYTYTDVSSLRPLTETYTAEPRIINRQFILREEWTISNGTGADLPLFPEDKLVFITPCPHLGLWASGLARSRSRKELNVDRCEFPFHTQLQKAQVLREMTMVEDGIESAFESPGRWIYNSCLRCHTDFGIIVSIAGRKATIQAWHNFGTEGSSTDASWKVHVLHRMPHVPTPESYVHYAHGSIRELWQKGNSGRGRAGAGHGSRRPE
ncbi:hypothetical protein Trco_004061 [Trichoderma cornu-damae]|uniref:F-box domain-containing protein n=1 Tax=Trichoderma cornu-damae TaxID=654480 RepID=A0A9P8TWR8_9HYPO|nr:hypothetical protein Trco_004061 [Trichoderma cornu-damae]